MSEATAKECGHGSTQMKNNQRKGSKMELFLTSVYMLHLSTCMFVELVTSGKESGTIKRELGDEVLNN